MQASIAMSKNEKNSTSHLAGAGLGSQQHHQQDNVIK